MEQARRHIKRDSHQILLLFIIRKSQSEHQIDIEREAIPTILPKCVTESAGTRLASS